jgi:hypothetical protein
MRDEMMDQENSSSDSGKKGDCDKKGDAGIAMEARLIEVLETRPEVHIPAGFAARVAGQVPARRPASLTPTHHGQNAMVVSVVVLLIALLAWAPQNAGHSALGVALEWILCAQFASLAYWLGVRRQNRR